MIIRYTVFKDEEFGNGAFKRSHQIISLLNQSQQEVINVKKCPLKAFGPGYLERLKIGFAYFSFFGQKVYSIARLKEEAIKIYSWMKYIRQISNNDFENLTVAYEHSASADQTFIYACKLLKVKVIGLPHNLESLVPNQKSTISGIISPLWFDEEITSLKICETVYCISREEQWLLNLNGIKAKYLPYYPSFSVLENCKKTKIGRASTNKDFFLTIGTAINPPTMLGFLEIMKLYSTVEDAPELRIGGFETELLNNYPESKLKNIKILGSLTKEDLEYNLLHCKAILIHQFPSTGALTKIPELLHSGIPILCNEISNRNYLNVQGINVYHTKEEFNDLISKESFEKTGEFPEMDLYFQEFLESLN